MLKYPGQKLNYLEKFDNYTETFITFESIVNNTKITNIIKPDYQGSLLEDKCDDMVNEYLKNPLLLRLKNKIIIGCLNDNWYLIDGQHRLEMAKQLYMNFSKNDKLIFCWYKCHNENEMKELFTSLNKDSIKNEFYIKSSDFLKLIITEFKSKLKINYKEFFSKKETTIGYIKSIDEFVKELVQLNYFENFSNSQLAFENLIKNNKEFYDKNRYLIELETNRNSFYIPEIKHIENKIIFPLKNSNFLMYLIDNKTEPIHKKKVQKQNITSYLRNKVWEKEFSNSEVESCPIKFCNNKLFKSKKGGWQAGHLISEKNGGELKINNLRPICSECNRSMGIKNWIDYESYIENLN